MLRIIERGEPITFSDEELLTIVATQPVFTRWQRWKMWMRIGWVVLVAWLTVKWFLKGKVR